MASDYNHVIKILRFTKIVDTYIYTKTFTKKIM